MFRELYAAGVKHAASVNLSAMDPWMILLLLLLLVVVMMMTMMITVGNSAGFLGWPFPMLKYKSIFPIKYTEAILSNSTRKLLCFEITKMLVVVLKNNFIVLFIIISGTLSLFPLLSSTLPGPSTSKVTTLWRYNIQMLRR